MSSTVALVEPDASTAAELERLLTRRGFSVVSHSSLGRFFDSLERRRPDVLVMDMHLPGMAGREIVRALRANPETKAMVLVGLSRKAPSQDEVTSAIQAGADEYFFKPLDPELVAARLQSLVRRAPAPAADMWLRYGGLAVDPESRVCKAGAKEVRLTRLEFDLLAYFIRNPKRVLTRGNLIDTLWRGDASRGARAVDRHMHALRAKLGPWGRFLETLVGVGYRLADGGSSK